MKKVLMVLMGLEIGGAETHVVGLSLTLQQRGWEVVVASNGGVYEKKLEEHGIRHYQIPANTRAPGDMRRSYVGLRRIIELERPDVVHAHARIPAFLCGILQRKMSFPFVTTAHWVFRVNPVLRLLTDWGQQTIAVSEDIREYLIRHYDLPAGQIHTTVNGIDTDEFSPAVSGAEIRREFQIPVDAMVVTCVTRLHESRAKSAELLLACAPSLAKKVPAVRMLIVGDGERMKELQHQAKRINDTLGYPCVILTGGRTDVAGFVAAGDVFVGVSRAALEAMSGGKPVLLCGNEGYGGLASEENAQENLATNYCCRGCPMPEEALLEQDLLTLLTCTLEERKRLGAESRAIVQREFSLETMAKDCENAYELALHPKKKVLVSGYYGYGNLGDDTILETICRSYGAAYELMVLSKTPRQTAMAYGVTAIPRFHMGQVHKAIRGSSMLISGGGSLLQDRTSTRSLLYYLAVIRMALRRHKPVMVYANGIGPVNRRRNRRQVTKVLSRVTAITLRDEDSWKELQEMGLTRSDLVVTADPVFEMVPASTERAAQIFAQTDIPMDRPLLGVSLRTVSRGAQQKIAQLLDGICKSSGCVPVFLCMQPSVDARAAQDVMGLMAVKGYLLSGSLCARDMMAVIREMEAVISMRLHTLIFAADAGTPVLGFDYDPKLVSLLRTLDMPSLGSIEQLQPEKALPLACSVLEQTEALREKMHTAAAAQREKAAQNDSILRQLLSAGPQPRRVMFLIGGGDTGGAKTHVLSLLRELMDDGYETLLVCFMEGPFAQEARELGIPTEVLPRTKVVHCYRALLAMIRKMQPDLVHCHGAKANMFGRMLMGQITQPVLTTVHSDPQLDYLGRPMAKLLYGTINDWALRKIPYRVCVSDTMRQLLIGRRFNEKSLYVIYNGVAISPDPPALTRSEFFEKIGLSVEKDSVVFGIAARLSPVKDIPTLLTAFSQVAAQEPSARLVIAGDGEEAQKLRALAEKLCPAGTYCFAGWLQDTDSFYHAIDVNMLTSLSEGFPYALPEGGKMHCATIATAVGGIPYMVVDGETGMLLQPGDVDRLVQLMLEMIQNPELRNRLAEAMYQRTCRDFSLEATLHTQEKIYQDILRREWEATQGA